MPTHSPRVGVRGSTSTGPNSENIKSFPTYQKPILYQRAGSPSRPWTGDFLLGKIGQGGMQAVFTLLWSQESRRALCAQETAVTTAAAQGPRPKSRPPPPPRSDPASRHPGHQLTLLPAHDLAGWGLVAGVGHLTLLLMFSGILLTWRAAARTWSRPQTRTRRWASKMSRCPRRPGAGRKRQSRTTQGPRTKDDSSRQRADSGRSLWCVS